MRFDLHFAEKHPDTDSLFLGCLERTEQISTDEFGRHAAAIVRHRYSRPAIASRGRHANLAIFADGIQGVGEKIRDHFLYLIGIEFKPGQITGERALDRDRRQTIPKMNCRRGVSICPLGVSATATPARIISPQTTSAALNFVPSHIHSISAPIGDERQSTIITDNRDPSRGKVWNSAASPIPNPIAPLITNTRKPAPPTPPPNTCAYTASSAAANNSRQKFASFPPMICAVRLPHTAEIENRIVVKNAAAIAA